MSQADIGNDAKLTESMVLDAIDLAEQNKVINPQEIYSDSKLSKAIAEIEGNNSEIKVRVDELNISESKMLDAVNVVIKKRQTFPYLLHPIRKMLPKWMLKELPLEFLDKEIEKLGFLDKLTKKIKKI